jgi:hypothetical protein
MSAGPRQLLEKGCRDEELLAAVVKARSQEKAAVRRVREVVAVVFALVQEFETCGPVGAKAK